MAPLAVLKNEILTNEINAMWAHQVEAFEFCSPLEAALLAMDMGTGKTRVAIELMREWAARLTLIVCPVSVLGVWPGELDKFAEGEFKILVLNKGTVAAKAKLVQEFIDRLERSGERGVIVINYEAFWRGDMQAVILKNKFDLVIYDEIHRLKTPGSKASRFAGRLHDKIPRRLGLSGTPLAQSLADVYGIYRALDNSIFGTSRRRFENRYCIKGGFNNYQIVAYQNEDELKEKFFSIAFRVTKAECLDLPDQIFTDRTFEMTGEIKRIYKEMAKDFYAWVREDVEVVAANAAVKVLRLQQITSGICKSDTGQEIIVGDGKAKLLRDLLEDINNPVVVFCRFRKDLETVQFITEGLNRVYGEVSGSRKDLTENSKMPESIDVMGVQIQSGSAGIDLTRSSVAIYYSVGYSLLDYEQSLSRLHRPGQRNAVTYYRLIAKGSIDEKVFKALADRKNVINSILNNGESYDF